MAPVSLRTRLFPVFAIFVVITYIAFTILLFLLIALSSFKDKFTIPYLSPLSRFLGDVLYPLMPAWGAIFMGAFIKAYKYKKEDFPGRGSFLFVSGSQAFQLLRHFPVWIANVVALFDSEILGEPFCGPQKCHYAWIEGGLLAFVVGAEYLGLRWDLGKVQKLVDAIAAQEVRDQGAKRRRKEQDVTIQRALDVIVPQEVKGEERAKYLVDYIMEELKKDKNMDNMEKGVVPVEDVVEKHAETQTLMEKK